MAHRIVGVREAEEAHHSAGHHHHHGHHHGKSDHGARSVAFWVYWTLAGGVFVLTSFWVKVFSPVDSSGELLWRFHMDLIAGIGAFMLGALIIGHALKNLIAGHMHMDELVALAILAAFAIGDYQVAGVIAFFLLLSELIETRTAIGARASIEDLIKLSPKTARLVIDDEEQEVQATSLKQGQRVRIRPGENIPADGKVVFGESTVDQANITGESLPVDKRPDDAVFSGTTNLTGALEVEVTKVGADTTLGRVQSLILQAEQTRIPIMRLIDRYVVWYTPVILILAMLVFFFNRENNGAERAITMLVASCPCALIMATPTAMVAGLSCAARLGILIKDVGHLESAGRLTAVVFDKTGTLTTGELSVSRLIPAHDTEGERLLRLAASAEQSSNHPAARALVKVAAEANIPLSKPDRFEEVAGKGVIAEIDGDEVLVGRALFLTDKGVDLSSLAEAQARTEGMSQLFVSRGKQLLGMVALEDRTRSVARQAVQELHDQGMRRLAMLTGDRHAVAKRVAAEMACTEFKADCLPQEKLDLVEQMRRQGHRVMVVGDGVNDAPALAAGDLGVAMGAAGSDVAINSASIALMNNDLTRLPFLIRLSRATRRVVVQNLVFGVLFVITVMALGAFSIVPPIVAAILHTVSSFVVVFNSARLVRFGEEKATHEQVIAEDRSVGPAAVPATA